MEPILYLVHRIPYPPDKGDKIRSYHILRHLSGRYRVILGAFVDEDRDLGYRARLYEYCEEVFLLPLHPKVSRLRSLQGFLKREPLTLPYFRSGKMARWSEMAVAERGIEKALVFSSAMAQYLQAKKFASVRKIIDFVDMDSDKWRQYGESVAWPMSWIYRRESEYLLRYEITIARSFDHALFVSEAEAAHFRSFTGVDPDRVSVLGNGVDLEYFSPSRAYECPYPEGKTILVFTGAMDYWANIDAVLWFADEVFPIIKKEFPEAMFYIVGSKPDARVTSLERRDSAVRVTGRVPDIRPFLAHASVSVAPLRIARGIQNKILEAMAMELPVFATPAAAEGLVSLTDDCGIFIEHDPPSLARRIVQFLRSENNRRAGIRARRYVGSNYRWDSKLAYLDVLLDG